LSLLQYPKQVISDFLIYFLDLHFVHLYAPHMTHRPITPDALRRRIRKWDAGQGFEAALEAFAAAMPVSPRTVYYWLSGERTIRPVIAERIRSVKPSPSSRSNQPRPHGQKER
jgi:hypothetical protein